MGEDQPQIPVYIAGYGPRVLAVAGRIADGVIVQLADPEIIEWIVGQVRAAAEEAGRDPSEIKVIACAPAHVSDDIADACEQVRWFPAMVSNHVFDLLAKHDKASLPLRSPTTSSACSGSSTTTPSTAASELSTASRCRTRPASASAYSARPSSMSRSSAPRSRRVDQWNIYLMTSGQEETLETYGQRSSPVYGDGDALDGVVHVAAEVPRRLQRLLVPGRVARAAAQLVLARCGAP